jgi:hypothetical protein
MYHGDGTSNVTEVGGIRVRLYKDNKEVVDEFARVLAVLSGESVTVKENKDPRYNVPMWYIEKTFAPDNKLTKRWTNLVGDFPSDKHAVVEPPEWIAGCYDQAIFFSYLAGLVDSDGFVLKDHKVFISSSSKPMIDALTKLCPIYGLYPWLTTIAVEDYPGTGYTPTLDMHRLGFSSYDLRHCYLQNSAKKKKLEASLKAKITRRKRLVIPAEHAEREVKNAGITGAQMYNFRYQVEDNQSCYSGYYVSRGKSYDHLLEYDQVVAIDKELDIDENFKDLSIEDNHSYLCGEGSYYYLHNCGTGFKAKDGTLSGFSKPVKVSTIRSERTIEDYNNGFRGRETNQEQIVRKGGTVKYVLSIGDSAQAWAKSVGKLLALKEPVDEIIIDFREIRAGGVRLKGYGWISSGDETLSKALVAICQILSKRAGQLLSKMDIHDILTWLGTTLSSRRSAEISVMELTDPEWEEFALCKKDHFELNPQRAQSNNSTLFYRKPNRLELRALFHIMEEGGGSEPGILNAVEARRRAPWFSGTNP